MPNPEEALPVRIGVALAVALSLFAFPAASQVSAVASPPTDAQCRDQWAQSEVDDDCQNESVAAGMCRVQADCRF